MNECIGSNAGQWAFLLLSFHHLLPHHTPLRLFPRDAGVTHVRGKPVAKQSHPAMTHITKGGIQKKRMDKMRFNIRCANPLFLANYPLTAKMHSILRKETDYDVRLLLVVNKP